MSSRYAAFDAENDGSIDTVEVMAFIPTATSSPKAEKSKKRKRSELCYSNTNSVTQETSKGKGLLIPEYGEVFIHVGPYTIRIQRNVRTTTTPEPKKRRIEKLEAIFEELPVFRPVVNESMHEEQEPLYKEQHQSITDDSSYASSSYSSSAGDIKTSNVSGTTNSSRYSCN